MSEMVNVVCPACQGTGDNAEGVGCGTCLMQGHIRVNRAVDGAVPTEFIAWVDAEFGTAHPPKSDTYAHS
jgi:hypothetical protein